MGTGEHGGFGHTSGSSKSRIFTRVYFEGTVRVGGEVCDVSRRVYQPSDIDFDYFDSNTKRTNFQRMMDGDAPIGNDGKPVQLHHVLQRESGPMAEVRKVTHHEYRRTPHGLVRKGNSFGNNPVLRKRYNNFGRA